jgi:predicted nucleotidyltransferase
MTIIESFPLLEINRFCKKWQILELALSGSVLRVDHDPESHVDVLVTFSDKSEWSLFDHVQMQKELQALLKRKVDLIYRRVIEHIQNQLPSDEILKMVKVIFTQG